MTQLHTFTRSKCLKVHFHAFYNIFVSLTLTAMCRRKAMDGQSILNASGVYSSHGEELHLVSSEQGFH